jgi:hypothetical protein
LEGGLDPHLDSMADGFLSKRLALKYGFCFAPRVVATWQVRREGLSRTTSRTAEHVLALLNKVRTQVARDPVFPPGYDDLFERRWRFATCRLALAEESPNWKFLRTIGPQGIVDHAFYRMAQGLPRPWGAYGALVWLTMRLRPYSLLALADTSLRRRWANR